MKFQVELIQQVARYATYEIEAESKEEAKELAWDEHDRLGKELKAWREKVLDSSTEAHEIPESRGQLRPGSTEECTPGPGNHQE